MFKENVAEGSLELRMTCMIGFALLSKPSNSMFSALVNHAVNEAAHQFALLFSHHYPEPIDAQSDRIPYKL
jgi:hypothetical protein